MISSARLFSRLCVYSLAAALVILPASRPIAAQSTFVSPDDNAAPKPPKAVGSLDLSAIDKTADPCTDFYQYACGNWVKDNPVPADQTRWARSFSLLGERNRYLLWEELDAAAKDPKSPLQKKYGDYFAACMNTDAVESKGLSPLAPAFKEIDSFSDPKKLASLMGQLLEQGSAAPLFRFEVEQDAKDSTKQIAQRLSISPKTVDNHRARILEKMQVDNTTQSVLAKAQIANANDALRTAQLIRARVVWGNAEKPVVPVISVTRIGGLYFAFIAEPDQKGGYVVHQKPLQIGQIVANDYVVLGGVRPGDKIVVSTTQFLIDGMPVIPQESSS